VLDAAFTTAPILSFIITFAGMFGLILLRIPEVALLTLDTILLPVPELLFVPELLIDDSLVFTTETLFTTALLFDAALLFAATLVPDPVLLFDPVLPFDNELFSLPEISFAIALPTKAKPTFAVGPPTNAAPACTAALIDAELLFAPKPLPNVELLLDDELLCDDTFVTPDLT
jgi:hypothetical protein